MTPEQLGFKECARCHCLRPAKELDESGRCRDWPHCKNLSNGATGPQTGGANGEPG